MKSQSKNVKQDNAILSEFEKMTNCVGQNYKSADVLTIGELIWTRTLNISEHTSSTPVPIPRAILKPIVLLQSCSPKVQKTVRRLQLDMSVRSKLRLQLQFSALTKMRMTKTGRNIPTFHF